MTQACTWFSRKPRQSRGWRGVGVLTGSTRFPSPVHERLPQRRTRPHMVAQHLPHAENNYSRVSLAADVPGEFRCRSLPAHHPPEEPPDTCWSMSTVNAEHAALRVEEATDAFDQLTALLDQFEPIEAVLEKLVGSAMATIPDTGSATVTVLRNGEMRTLASTSPWAAELDEAQYMADDGPCLHAARTGRLVRVDAVGSEKWPDFCTAAHEQQVAVALGVPLLIDEDIMNTTAALNLTTPKQQAFDPLDEALLELFTHALSTAINHAYRHQQARLLVDQLGDALDSRDVIGQAKGLLMARHRCGADEAFGYLREASQQSNIKLHEVAARLVASESGAQRG